MEDPERGMTYSTSVHMTDEGKYEVTGMGGYDGFLRTEFDQIEDALDYMAALWHCDTTTNHYLRLVAMRRPRVRR